MLHVASARAAAMFNSYAWPATLPLLMLIPLLFCYVTIGAWPKAGAGGSPFSPHAQLTVLEGQVERDDTSFFQVITEAWQSTRVRISIEDCTPLTAVIASFGAEPVPSRHDFLAHATLDQDGNGTCGVDLISRPSYIRDGAWHFAVVGGEPLLGARNIASAPDTLKFEAVIVTESAVYPTLDRGVADWGVCVRRVSVPPTIIPTVRYSGAGNIDFLPMIGRFPPGGARRTVKEGNLQEVLTTASWPYWLGEFMVSAYDEVVAVQLEVAALVHVKPATRRGKRYPTGGHRDKAFGGEEDRAAGSPGRSKSEGGKRWWRRGRELASGVKREKDGEGFRRDRRHGTKSCKVILCAAAGVIPSVFPQELVAAPERRGGSRIEERTRVCRLATVEKGGTAARGVLELPHRPQAGQWYVTARAECDNSFSSIGHGRPQRRLGLGEPSNKRETNAATTGAETAPFSVATNSSGSRSKSFAKHLPSDDLSAVISSAASFSSTNPSPGERKTKYVGRRSKDGGWGLAVLSLQRDWAHVEWRADALVPDGSENGADPRACPSAVGTRDAFELRGAVATQACPRGAVGIAGVDLQPLYGGGSSRGDDSSRRFPCVGTVLPMTASAGGGTDRVHKGQPRALSNLLFDEGGASGKEQSGGAVDGRSPTGWIWRGPQPPSVWYALDMSGREVGASVEIKLTVNSSAPASDASRSALDSPSAWQMGPYSTTVGGEDDAGPGCATGNGALCPLDEALFKLTVAVRAGALPEVDGNGTAQDDTWVLQTSDAVRVAVERVPCPSPSSGEDENAISGENSRATDDLSMRWSTTFVWSVTRPPQLRPARAGGAGLEKGDLATTLFVVIYGETIDDAVRRTKIRGEERQGADGVVRGGDGRERGRRLAGGSDDAEELLWGLGVAPQVAFRYCTEEACPAEKGVCRPTRGGDEDDYVTISKCHCFYGYGGEACAYRVVSTASLIWQFLVFVCSNLAVIPGVRVALRLGHATGAAPAVVLSLAGMASALYHTCDLELTCAAGLLSRHSLQAIDFFFSFFSVVALVLHLCPMPWDEPFVPHPIHSSREKATATAAEDGSDGLAGSICSDDGSYGHLIEDAGEGEVAVAVAHEGHHVGKDDDNGNDDRAVSGKEGDGTRLAALYACLTLPLLAGATEPPTAGVNLAIVFAMCGALLAFCWWRLVVRDFRDWRAEAAAKLDPERMERDVEVSDGGAAAQGRGAFFDGAGKEAVYGPTIMPSSAWDQRDKRKGDGRGHRKKRGDGGMTRYLNSSSPRRYSPLCGRDPAVDEGSGNADRYGGGSDDDSAGGDFLESLPLVPPVDLRVSAKCQRPSFGYSSGCRGGGMEDADQRQSRLGRVREVLRSLRRVTVDRGLLDWRQLCVGVAAFALGLMFSALQRAPTTINTFHLYHGAWRVLAMGSTAPLLRARRWGVVETPGGIVSSRRWAWGSAILLWRARLHACVRYSGEPIGVQTLEMVPGR